ncbi:alpha/beta fold hydrolase [Nocardia sp. CC201C]|uniref:alpha/beta hydrolase n=1 Tax=Nocardia sp. CC201C TaxID=3044575 RepID=UPI0024A9DF66|nr:alpha/beta fold hydrolase [Nocardia sp. CC201C]
MSLIDYRPVEPSRAFCFTIPVPQTSTATSLRTLDGLHLAATLVTPDQPTNRAVVLVHGGGVTREEGGFFTRLAAGLAEAGVASLRFDLRGHGDSEGRQEELTLSTILNDIRIALAHLNEATGAAELSLLGASFGGGICGYYAAKRPDELTRLVLLNPQFDYKKRTIDSRDYWANDVISEEKAKELNETGAVQFTPTLKHGRPLLNEVFWLKPNEVLGEIKTPTLVVHGNADTLVPIDGTRAALAEFTAPVELVEIEGSQHGFAVHDDPQYLNPQSQAYQAEVIAIVARWLTTGSTGRG